MRTEKFIQFYDSERKAILSKEGLIKYDRRIKKHECIIDSVREKIPGGAAYWMLRKTMLKTLVNISSLKEI